MRKEHVPVETKSFRPLDFQNDQNLFVRPSTPEKGQADMIQVIQSEPIPTFETELNSRIENTEIILTLKETQEAIQQAIRLGESEIDDTTFKEFLQKLFHVNKVGWVFPMITWSKFGIETMAIEKTHSTLYILFPQVKMSREFIEFLQTIQVWTMANRVKPKSEWLKAGWKNRKRTVKAPFLWS